MTKEIKVIKGDKTYIVKLDREAADNMIGIAVRVFNNKDNVMEHFLDFSKHSTKEIEQNIIKFADHFSDKEASKWVDGYLKDKR